MGNVIKAVDVSDYDKMHSEVVKYLGKEEQETEILKDSASFSAVLAAKKFDDWFLDPIVGFVIPEIGDLIASLAILPALYVSIFKVRSFKLTCAVFFCMLIDTLCGLIPVAGDIVDAFYKSNKKSARLIVGYVDGDKDTIDEVNRIFNYGLLALGIIGLALWGLYETVMSLVHWVQGLF